MHIIHPKFCTCGRGLYRGSYLEAKPLLTDPDINLETHTAARISTKNMHLGKMFFYYYMTRFLWALRVLTSSLWPYASGLRLRFQQKMTVQWYAALCVTPGVTAWGHSISISSSSYMFICSSAQHQHQYQHQRMPQHQFICSFAKHEHQFIC